LWCRSLALSQPDAGEGLRMNRGAKEHRREKDVLAPLSHILYAAAIIVCVTIGNACASANVPVPLRSSLDGTWRLVSVDSRPLRQLPAIRVPFFTVTGITIIGFDGCNNFSGRIDQPGNISATRRGCLETTIKLPLDLGDLQAHLRTGTIDKKFLSVPARGQFPAAMFERSE
jgi:hypothetical protein